MQWYFVGAMAALLTTFSFVSQIIKIFHPKSLKDVSLPTFIHFSVGVSLWALYGFHLQDIIISANTTILLTLIVAIVLYCHYRRITKSSWSIQIRGINHIPIMGK